ncbi:hypothetical protein GZL_08343 [Streptomyces sp. 769]|nr:hypothetical protein GZL_08343 [Streptomyces sp. 769]
MVKVEAAPGMGSGSTAKAKVPVHKVKVPPENTFPGGTFTLAYLCQLVSAPIRMCHAVSARQSRSC